MIRAQGRRRAVIIMQRPDSGERDRSGGQLEEAEVGATEGWDGARAAAVAKPEFCFRAQ